MNRKIIRTILCVVLLMAFVLSSFSGCKSEEDKNHYTILQWLDKVEETFNLLYYSEQEPLVKSVKTSDDSFETVQIAAEWGIIDPNDDLKFNDKLTKEFAADTLIRAMNCVTPSTVDISDSQKVKPLYLENVMSSVNEGIFALDGGKFNPAKKLSTAEADSAMFTAYYKWINFSYGESFDRSTVKENVINLGGVTSENSTVVPAEYSVKYTGSKTFFDENGSYSDNTNKTITFQADDVPAGLTVDTVLAMPADNIIPMNYAVVITDIKTNSDGSVTVSTRNAELEDVYEEIDFQQSGPLDFSNAVFFGPDGKRLTFSDYTPAAMSNTSDSGKVESLGLYRPGEQQTVKTKNKASGKLDLGNGLSIKVYYSDDDDGKIGFQLEGEVNGSGGEKLSISVGFEDSFKIESRLKTHWDWFKLKVDTLKFTRAETKTVDLGFECSVTKNPGKTINKVNSGEDGKLDVGDWSTEAAKLRRLYKDARTIQESYKDLSKEAKEATNKKLFDVIIGGNFHLVVRAELTVEGSLKITFTQSNVSGVELMNGKLRPVSENSNSQKLELSAKAELAIRGAIELQFIGINVADIGVKGGIGAKASSVVYSLDRSTHTLLAVCGFEGAALPPFMEDTSISEDLQISKTGIQVESDESEKYQICQEIKVYPIVSGFVCSSSSVAGKLFGSLEIKVFDEDTPFLVVHYEIDEDGGKLVSDCTISAEENYGITTDRHLTLNVTDYAVKVSEEADTGLAIETLPNGTFVKDVTISSDDNDVLEVENLMNKTTTDVLTTPKAKWELNTEVNAVNYFLPKDSPLKVNFSGKYKIGSWFFEDLTGGKKPQFALTGKKNGVANVTITAGGESVTVPVQVGTGEEPIVSSGALISSKGTFTLAPGETAQTAFDFIPNGKTIADISFTSADSSVAAVSSGGLITAVGTGDTIITATLRGEDKDFTTTFTVHVIA